MTNYWSGSMRSSVIERFRLSKREKKTRAKEELPRRYSALGEEAR